LLYFYPNLALTLLIVVVTAIMLHRNNTSATMGLCHGSTFPVGEQVAA